MNCDLPRDCGAPAVTVGYAMCVHEHYRERRMCAEHAVQVMRRNDAGRMICEACFEGRDRHSCAITIERKPVAA